MRHWILSRSFILVQRENRRLEKIADNWRSVVWQDEERMIPHSNGLNDVKLVNEMSTSRSDLFKPALEKNKGHSEEELNRVRSHWLKWNLPTCGMMSNKIWLTLLRQNNCWNFGSDQQNLRSCQKKLETCRYPHYNTRRDRDQSPDQTPKTLE